MKVSQDTSLMLALSQLAQLINPRLTHVVESTATVDEAGGNVEEDAATNMKYFLIGLWERVYHIYALPQRGTAPGTAIFSAHFFDRGEMMLPNCPAALVCGRRHRKRCEFFPEGDGRRLERFWRRGRRVLWTSVGGLYYHLFIQSLDFLFLHREVQRQLGHPLVSLHLIL